MCAAGLVERIADFAFVSFDLFDTAILRTVPRPTDVFELVARQYVHLGGNAGFGDCFPTARRQAEVRARERAWQEGRRAEVSLAEIYACLHLPRDAKEQLAELEIAAELAVCRPNPDIHAMYRRCVERGQKVIFTSDIYLPESVIRTLLSTNGYSEFHRLYVSNACSGMTKSIGELYRYMARDLAVAPAKIVHIGDNWDSDVVKARREGVCAWHYRRSMPPGPPREFLGAEPAGPPEAETLLFHGLLHSQPAEPERDFWYRFGYEQAGILYFGFVDWILRRVIAEKRERVFFLARDGHVLHQIYELLAPFYPNAPPASYLYASRRALNVPALTELDDVSLDFLTGGSTVLNVAQYLERVGLDADRYREQARRAGFVGLEHIVNSARDRERLRSLWQLIAGDLLEHAAEERALVLEYLEQAGLLGERRVAVVDLGWHGTLQRSLERLIALSGRDISVQGLYLGTFAAAARFQAEGQQMEGFLCTNAEPVAHRDLIGRSVEIFEFLHAAPHGGVVRFRREGTVVAPVLSEHDADAHKRAAALAVQTGALDFVRRLAELRARFPFVSISPELAVAPLARVLMQPTGEEVTRLGDLTHVESFGAVRVPRPIARPPRWAQALLRPGSLVEGYETSFWREGYARRLVGDNPRLRKAARRSWQMLDQSRSFLERHVAWLTRRPSGVNE